MLESFSSPTELASVKIVARRRLFVPQEAKKLLTKLREKINAFVVIPCKRPSNDKSLKEDGFTDEWIDGC